MEHAQSYYTQLSRQVRAHRDQLTSTHLDLKIRHQFKLGFYAEMRSDSTTAIKYVDYCRLSKLFKIVTHIIILLFADTILKHMNGLKRSVYTIPIAWRSK